MVVAVGDGSAIVYILDGKATLRANVAALSKVSHKFQHLGVIAFYLELFHFLELGHMD